MTPGDGGLWPTEQGPEPGGVHFRVFGSPAPQGSKKGFVNPRTMRAVIVDDNKAPLRSWRQDITRTAIEARGQIQFTGPVLVEALFYLKRPAAHFGVHGLKPNAPSYVMTKPDLDKLLRGLLDAVTASGLWRDDSQVASFGNSRKVYGEQPGVEVWILPL
jgi:Holliday junction resolvase RusA-like endonuclease